jgi:murein DD-endopeptidase MepM/ murein hydrolase activator NlpD
VEDFAILLYMNKLIQLGVFFFALFSFILFFTKNSFATWYYPMDKYYERQTVKGFGEYIDNSFYKGKEVLFPYNRFYGYHTAVDLEVFPDEIDTKVPVYAASSGTITYIGTLSGYGGVILEKIDNENNTILYGHVKTENLSFKVGDHINTENNPVILTYLGNQFSAETSKERKHLHLGIYKGTDLYFKGHESSLAQLEKRWLNPNTFLKEKEAIDPVVKPTSTTAPTNIVNNSENKRSFFSLTLNWLKELLGNL